MRNADPNRIKVGVCSTQLGGLAENENAVVFVTESSFRLPEDPSIPVIMVGAGTGVAPFRAFVQQLSCERPTIVRNSRLYFGCRRPHVDFLYENELRTAESSGALTALRLAFSREEGKKKVYVQDALKSDAKELSQAIFSAGASVFICGGTAMGRDVKEALGDILVEQSGMSKPAATAYLKNMAVEGRLVSELWS